MYKESGCESLYKPILEALGKGKRNAKTGSAIAKQLKVDYIAIRFTIKDMVRNHNQMIGGCRDGYYISETPDEMDEVCRGLRNRAMAILVRCAKLQKCSLEEIFNQGRFDYIERRDI